MNKTTSIPISIGNSKLDNPKCRMKFPDIDI